MSTTTPDAPVTDPVNTPESTTADTNGTPTPAPAKPRVKPVYTVYSADASGILTPVGVNVDAANDLDAIRIVVATLNSTSGRFVAVSNRNLRIREVAVESTPRVVIS